MFLVMFIILFQILQKIRRKYTLYDPFHSDGIKIYNEYIMPKTRRNQKKCGGGSTSEYGTYVWGTGNQQHAIGNGSNLIAAVNDPQSYTGGKRKSVKKGGDLATIAVPAVLIAANHLYKPKKHLRDIKKGAPI